MAEGQIIKAIRVLDGEGDGNSNPKNLCERNVIEGLCLGLKHKQ